jgi:hypothetical protein
MLNFVALTFTNWRTISVDWFSGLFVTICKLRAEGMIVLPRVMNRIDKSPLLFMVGITDFK